MYYSVLGGRKKKPLINYIVRHFFQANLHKLPKWPDGQVYPEKNPKTHHAGSVEDVGRLDRLNLPAKYGSINSASACNSETAKKLVPLEV